MSHLPLNPHELRMVAVNAAVDPRTIKKHFEGRSRPTLSARIEQALEVLGFSERVKHAATEHREAA
jgi:hypothetical protein